MMALGMAGHFYIAEPAAAIRVAISDFFLHMPAQYLSRVRLYTCHAKPDTASSSSLGLLNSVSVHSSIISGQLRYNGSASSPKTSCSPSLYSRRPKRSVDRNLEVGMRAAFTSLTFSTLPKQLRFRIPSSFDLGPKLYAKTSKTS